MTEARLCGFDEILLGFRMIKKDGKTVREKTGLRSMKARIQAAQQMVQVFEELHAEGKVFRSLSTKDFEIDPETGEVQLRNKENIVMAGSESRLENLPFLPPEVIIHRENVSSKTDQHALSVLLFELFMKVHPLEGIRCNEGSSVTVEREAALYGERPLFIFDPEDSSNHLQDSIRDRVEKVWNSYPEYLRKAFTKSFTTALQNPSERISGKEWLHMFEFMNRNVEKRIKKAEE